MNISRTYQRDLQHEPCGGTIQLVLAWRRLEGGLQCGRAIRSSKKYVTL